MQAKRNSLIYFRTRSIHTIFAKILFNDTPLCYSDRVVHLGHILTYDLDDRPDIIRVVKEMNCKANSILCTFKWADPLIKCFLVKPTVCHCMALSCGQYPPSLKIIEVSLNKLIRNIWSLPYNSHAHGYCPLRSSITYH